ncbi:MAG: hypothetical protein RJA22_1838 [Verrucomicrobiota bacterium]|jgi:hypothetical protein
MNRPAPRLRLPALLALLALLATGCSTARFNRAWREAAQAPAAGTGLAGRWEGTWRSDVNAHTGRLRCLVTPATNGTFAARFHAEYRLILPLTFSYTVPLTVTNGADPAGPGFAGTANLGRLAGGLYSYRGRATATNFFSTYECARDRGIFEMTRPAPGE